MLSTIAILCIALYPRIFNPGSEFTVAGGETLETLPRGSSSIHACLLRAESKLICAFHFLNVSKGFSKIYQAMLLLIIVPYYTEGLPVSDCLIFTHTYPKSVKSQDW